MTVRPYPDGTCREYKPLCLSGHERCETDKYGCEACTCVSSEVGSRAPGPWTPR